MNAKRLTQWDRYMVYAQLGLLVISVITPVLFNRISWWMIAIWLLPGVRYLVFPVYPEQKAELFASWVDRFVPFTTLEAALNRKSDIPWGTFAIRLGGIAMCILLIVKNGYQLLYLELRYWSYGQQVELDPTTPIEQTLSGYHLASAEKQVLRTWALSNEPAHQREYRKTLTALHELTIAQQYAPLGINITQSRFSRTELEDKTKQTGK
ncbi:hypothetical protein ACI3E1_07290 [Ligilactobacillus sp. LYQ139]|uniref:hypothetical protein n=1 Tax=Ligilactobacillus sp. LYQ139 TaxID=3378800 RepID=UPI003852E29D